MNSNSAQTLDLVYYLISKNVLHNNSIASIEKSDLKCIRCMNTDVNKVET